MDQDIAAALRAPFPPEKVGKLPRVWCGACSKASRQEGACGQHGHHRQKCTTCKANITTAHLHLDYVGHADVTDRLLQVDPGWSWEPLAFTDTGLPAMDEHTGLWIRLTVAGVTRLGYGHPDGKTGGNAIKEAIGDAIRNAALRYGVALDLWRKERDLDPAPPGKQKEGDSEVVSLRRTIVAVGAQKGLGAVALIEGDFRDWSQGKEITNASAADLAQYLGYLKRKPNGGES